MEEGGQVPQEILAVAVVPIILPRIRKKIAIAAVDISDSDCTNVIM
jgi:hypothetical protein